MQKAYKQLRRYVLNTLFNAPPGTPNEGYRLQLGGEAFVLGVVTNGSSWTVYDFDPSATEPHEPICKFDLKDGLDYVAQFVRTIGRQHLLDKLSLS
jgi:hypothetical protein